MYSVKERIRKFRRQMKWTQADFATRMGVTRDVVASWENGRVEPPEAVIRLICREYDISYDWLKNGRETMPTTNRSNSRRGGALGYGDVRWLRWQRTLSFLGRLPHNDPLHVPVNPFQHLLIPNLCQ